MTSAPALPVRFAMLAWWRRQSIGRLFLIGLVLPWLAVFWVICGAVIWYGW